ncbi:MAG: YaiO family outer membrane beta-barrel protein [Hyphomicrobiales bacterium]|nr:YaiO family outer membrane beta-barrel protein [Hyphomicrobiales bacterium]
MDELYAAGVKARQERRFDDAEQSLKRALTLKPDNADALVQLGFAELDRGDLAAARDAFSKALSLAPNYSDAKFGMAEIEFRSGNLDAAAALAEPLAREQPANSEYAVLLANIRKARQAKQTPHAKTAMRKAGKPEGRRRQPHPDPVAVLLDRGRTQRAAGNFAEAERAYREALRLAPRNIDALVALGLVAGSQRKFDEAGRFFDAALAIHPDNTDARLGQARLAIWRGDTGRARGLVNNVLQRAPGNTEARLLDARIALLEGDYPRAERKFAAMAASDPKSAEALIGLGDARRARGDDPGARQAYGRALALEPGSADIQNRLAAPLPRKWRLDIGSEVSDLSAGRGTWTDSSVGLSYKVTPETTIGARTRLATRYGKTDVQIEGRIDQAFSPSFSVYGLAAATPDADFLARFSLGGGASWRAIPRTNGFGPVFLNLDVRYDQFATSDVATFSPWVQGFLFNDRLALSARWVHAQDDTHTRADGYVLRADVVVTPRLNVFAGYADAPEIDDGSLIPTRSVFGGASFDITGDLTLRGSFAHEERPAFDRNTFGLGITARF